MSDDEKAKFRLLFHECREQLREINAICKELRNRMLLFLTADLALLAYCFTNLAECLPEELYGIIFFAIGVGCLIASLCVIVAHFCVAKLWLPPHDLVGVEKIKSLKYEKEALQTITNNYQSSCKDARHRLNKHVLVANLALILFLIGAAIIMIIKLF